MRAEHAGRGRALRGPIHLRERRSPWREVAPPPGCRHAPQPPPLLLTLPLAADEGVPAIPDGGQSLIGDRPLATAHVTSVRASLRVVDVDHPAFKQALEIRTTERPEVDYGIQVIWPALVGVARHEVLLVSFWARCTAGGDESGQGRLRGYYQRTVEPWEKAFNQAVQLGPEWRFFCFPFSLWQTGYEARGSSFYFAAGYDPQTVQMADLRVLTYKHGRWLRPGLARPGEARLVDRRGVGDRRQGRGEGPRLPGRLRDRERRTTVKATLDRDGATVELRFSN